MQTAKTCDNREEPESRELVAEAGSEKRDWEAESWSGKRESGSWKLEAGSWKLEADK
jgi:hypothetical protein